MTKLEEKIKELQSEMKELSLDKVNKLEEINALIQGKMKEKNGYEDVFELYQDIEKNVYASFFCLIFYLTKTKDQILEARLNKNS